MSEDWEKPLEGDGLTLGPEETLQREIEKSKTLKVDRLRLRNEIEQLKAQTTDLARENQRLKERLTALGENPSTEPEKASLFPRKLLIFALVFSFLTLLCFILRNGVAP